MTYSHATVIKDFVKERKNRNGGNMFANGNVVYSYGYHFPLLVRTTQEKYIMNADKYSISTSKHQHIAIKMADTAFPFSVFSGLTKHYKLASENPYRDPENFFNNMTILDVTEPREDITSYYIIHATTNEKILITIREYNELPPYHKETCYKNFEFRPGATLFSLSGLPGKKFLASMDQNQFYTVELPDDTAQTVEEAFHQLQPVWLQQHPQDFLRQGEWFFIDITHYVADNPRRCWKTFKTSKPLPNPDNGNEHIPTRLEFFNTLSINQTGILPNIPAGTPVVMGIIRHPEHGMLKLEKDHIYITLRNTAVNSWSTHGNVD